MAEDVTHEERKQPDEHAGERRKHRKRVVDPRRMRTPWLPELPFEPETALEALVATVVLGSVLAVGAVHPPVMAVLGGLCTVAGALALWLRMKRRRAFPLLWPAVTLLALAGYTALQLVPLPLGLLRAVAPSNADIWARSLLPFAEPGPGSAPVSLDPGATAMEVLRWSSYAAAFVAAAAIATWRGARWGVTLVFASAAIAAVTTIAHGLVGAATVWGLYEPMFKPAPWHLGPLLNPNNLSGYLNLGALCGLGLLLSDSLPLPRWSVAVGVAVILGVNVTSASRGGLVVLPIAVLALALIMEVSRLLRKQSAAAVGRSRWLMGGAVAFGAVLAVLAGTQQIWAELWDENLKKLEMVRWLRPMIGQYRWLGIGRGAFESVSPAFQPGQGSTVYTHAENFAAQWLIEWGIPVGVGALAVLAWHFRPKRMGVGRSAVAAGAWLGVVALLVQNLVDLGLEVPGVMFAVVVVLGSLWGDRRRAAAGETDHVGSRPRLAAAVAVGAFVLGALVVGNAAARGMHDVALDRARLSEAFTAAPPPRNAETKAALRAQIRASMMRHPAEPYFPLVGGMLAWQEHDQNAVPWLQRVLERSLVNGKAHLLLAQVLIGVPARSQALLELRLAVENDDTLTGPAAQLALKWAHNPDEILSTVPTGESRARSLDMLGALSTDRPVGARCDRMALELDPKLVGPHERLGADLVKVIGAAKGCPDGALCEAELSSLPPGLLGARPSCTDRPSCEALLETHIKAIETAGPGHSSAARLRASRLAALGKADEAEKVLAAECEKFDDFAACLRERALLASQIPDPDRLLSAEKALLGAVCSQRDSCAEAATWIGDVHAGRGEWGAAVNSYKAAVRDGESADRDVKLATAASKTGMHAQAARSLEQALKLKGGKDPELEKMLSDERDLAVGAAVGR